MSVLNWKVYGERTIACMLESEEIRKWLNHNLVVGPGEAAFLIKDGVVQETVTERKQKVGNWSDSHLPTFKKWLGQEHDYRVLMVRNAPFDIPFTITTYSLDRQELEGEGILRCQVVVDQPSQAKQIITLLGGGKYLAQDDILNRLKPELMARVIQPTIGGARHDELRGNVELLRSVETKAREELQRLSSSMGLFIESLTLSWGLTSEEKAAIQRKKQELEDEAVEFQHERRIRELEREAELKRLHIQQLQEEKRQAEQFEIERADMRLDANLSAQEKQEAMQIKLAEIDNQVKEYEIAAQRDELELEREKDKLEGERAQFKLDQKLKEMESIAELEIRKQKAESEIDLHEFNEVQRNKRERVRQQQEHELEMKRTQLEEERRKIDQRMQQMSVQVGTIERLMSQAIGSGVADSAALQKMLEEQTKMGASYQNEGAASKFFEAEQARHNVDSYKDAEDRERQHQRDMTQLSSNMMESSKQQPNPAIVTGGISQTGQSTNTNPTQTTNTMQCPNCNTEIKSNWKLCPECGLSLKKTQNCTNCGEEVKPHWKACPECGEKIT